MSSSCSTAGCSCEAFSPSPFKQNQCNECFHPKDDHGNEDASDTPPERPPRQPPSHPLPPRKPAIPPQPKSEPQEPKPFSEPEQEVTTPIEQDVEKEVQQPPPPKITPRRPTIAPPCKPIPQPHPPPPNPSRPMPPTPSTTPAVPDPPPRAIPPAPVKIPPTPDRKSKPDMEAVIIPDLPQPRITPMSPVAEDTPLSTPEEKPESSKVTEETDYSVKSPVKPVDEPTTPAQKKTDDAARLAAKKWQQKAGVGSGAADGDLKPFKPVEGDLDENAAWNIEISIDEVVYNDRRDKIVREILSTEQSYVKSLNLVVNGMLRPIRMEDAATATLSHLQIADIFSNAELILEVNKKLLGEVVDRMRGWTNETQIGDIFNQFTPFLRIYNTYAENYDNAMRVLDEAMDKKSKFQHWHERMMADPQFKGLSMKSFLIMPVQRIPRYNMLLSDLVKHTDESHPDFVNLTKALDLMKDVAGKINEGIRARENRDKLISIQKQFVGNRVELVEPSRKYIRDGLLYKVNRRGQADARYFFLFSDVLLYAEKVPPGGRFSLNRLMKMDNVRVTDEEDTEQIQFSFIIQAAEKSFQVYAESQEEKDAWLRDINSALEQLRENLRSRFGDSYETQAAPVWAADTSQKKCSLCQVEFTFIRRRHHCRQCGALVCDGCSKKRLVITHISKDPVRVCDTCYSSLSSERYAKLFRKNSVAGPDDSAAAPAPPAARNRKRSVGGNTGSQVPLDQKGAKTEPPTPPQRKKTIVPPRKQIIDPPPVPQKTQRKPTIAEPPPMPQKKTGTEALPPTPQRKPAIAEPPPTPQKKNIAEPPPMPQKKKTVVESPPTPQKKNPAEPPPTPQKKNPAEPPPTPQKKNPAEPPPTPQKKNPAEPPPTPQKKTVVDPMPEARKTEEGMRPRRPTAALPPPPDQRPRKPTFVPPSVPRSSSGKYNKGRPTLPQWRANSLLNSNGQATEDELLKKDLEELAELEATLCGEEKSVTANRPPPKRALPAPVTKPPPPVEPPHRPLPKPQV